MILSSTSHIPDYPYLRQNQGAEKLSQVDVIPAFAGMTELAKVSEGFVDLLSAKNRPMIFRTSLLCDDMQKWVLCLEYKANNLYAMCKAKLRLYITPRAERNTAS